jgi:hypothetical protein
MVISNYLDIDGRINDHISSELKLSTARPKRPEVRVMGDIEAVYKEELEYLKNLLVSSRDAHEVHLALAQTNALAAQRTSTISHECITGVLFASGSAQVVPHGIDEQVEYFPGFVKRRLLLDGITGFRPKVDENGKPLPIRWVQMAAKLQGKRKQDMQVGYVHEIKNVEEPLYAVKLSKTRTFWKKAGENASRTITFETKATYGQLVASIVQSMNPNAKVERGQWVQGPDGIREMVVVQGTVDGVEHVVLIECRDFDSRTNSQVGVKIIDAFDSKRSDWRATVAIICSNSGFTDDAIREAKRKKIGLVSILKLGDSRIKNEIIEEIYIPRIWLESIHLVFRNCRASTNTPPNIDLNSWVSGVELDKVLYNNKPIWKWLIYRAALSAATSPRRSGQQVSIPYRFIQSTELEFNGVPAFIDGFDLRFTPKVTWFAQTVRLDASLGMYDYLRRKIRLAGTPAQYIIKDVNLHAGAGTQINFVPSEADIGEVLLPGELSTDLRVVENGGDGEDVPEINALVVPEDLVLAINKRPE